MQARKTVGDQTLCVGRPARGLAGAVRAVAVGPHDEEVGGVEDDGGGLGGADACVAQERVDVVEGEVVAGRRHQLPAAGMPPPLGGRQPTRPFGVATDLGRGGGSATAPGEKILLLRKNGRKQGEG